MKKNYIGLFTLLFALCTVLILANITVAQGPREDTLKKCTDNKDNDGDTFIDGDDEDCDDVLSPPPTPTPTPTPPPSGDPFLNVGWTSPFNDLPSNPSIFEAAPRPCYSETIVADSNSGHYGCVHSDGGRGDQPDVFYNLPGIGFGAPDPDPDVEEITRNGDPELCNEFDGGRWLNPNTSYSLDWEGDCNGSCQIRILNWFHPDAALPPDTQSNAIEGVGLVIIEAFKDSTGLPNSNPFEDSLIISSFSEIFITFRAEGKNKTLAKCRYRGLAIEGIGFNSEPFVP